MSLTKIPCEYTLCRFPDARLICQWCNKAVCTRHGHYDHETAVTLCLVCERKLRDQLKQQGSTTTNSTLQGDLFQ